MAITKKMYRVHPGIGFHQSSLVTTQEAADQLAADGWSDDEPTGFKEGSIPGDSNAPATNATIEAVVPGDVM